MILMILNHLKKLNGSKKNCPQLIILKSQKIQTHEKNQNRLPIPAWEKSQEIFRLTDDGNLFSAQ